MEITGLISNPFVSFFLGALSILLAIFSIWLTIRYYKKNKRHEEIVETETQRQLMNIETSIEQFQDQEKLGNYSVIKEESNFLKAMNAVLILFLAIIVAVLIGHYLSKGKK